MIYNFDKSELSRISELLGVSSDELLRRVNLEDQIAIIAIFKDCVKIRTSEGQQILLKLKE